MCVSSKILGDVNISASCPGNHTLKFKGNEGIKLAHIVQKKKKNEHIDRHACILCMHVNVVQR